MDPIYCPTCGAVYDRDNPIRGEKVKLLPGMLFICPGCSDLFVFDDHLQMKMPTLTFLVGLAPKVSMEIAFAQYQVRANRPLIKKNEPLNLVQQ